MKRLLFFVCTISALVLTVRLTTGEKLSLRQGPEDPETATADAFGMKLLKNCTMCPRLYKPVCASNGRWYHNPCFMACDVGDDSSINIIYEGVCRPEHSSTLNPVIVTTTTTTTMTTISQSFDCKRCMTEGYKPVCGTDGRSYHNACFMQCRVSSDVKIAYMGKCGRSTSRFTVITSGFTYTDKFVSNCTMCPKIYDPVCATNGEWYNNPCAMYCTLGNNTDVKIRYHGKCIHFWRKSDNVSDSS